MLLGMRKAVDVANQFEKRVDFLSSLTGLQGDNLKWMSDQAKELSTSTLAGNIKITSSADAIVDAYTKVGSKRPELLKVKEDLNSVTKEAMILAAAADGDLQPAVDGLTMVLNQFNAPATDSRKIINILAAGALEGAGEIDYLTAAFEKSGSVANSLGISVEELTGVIETLAPRMTQPEMAGRNLRSIFIKMESQLNKELRPSIVGIGKAFENLRDKQYDIVTLQKMFGQENVAAVNILMTNTAETKKYTEAVTGTDVALKQASINTNNHASALAQAMNRVQLLSIEFGQKLAPALTFSTNAFSYFMKAVLIAPGFIREHQKAILALIGAFLAYNASVISNTAVTLFNYAVLKEGIGMKIKDAVATAAQAAQTQFLAIWKTNETVATKLAATAQWLWNAALAANPIGIVITALTAFALALKFYDENNANSVRIEDQKATSLLFLTRANEDLTKIYGIQAKELSRLNRLSADQIAALDKQIDATLRNAEAELILFEAKKKNIENATQTTGWQNIKANARAGNDPLWEKAYKEVYRKENATENTAEITDQITKLRGNIDLLKGQSDGLKDVVNAENIADAITGKSINQLEEKQKFLTTALKMYERGTADYIRVANKLSTISTLLEPKETDSESGKTESKAKSAAAKKLKLLEGAYKEEQEIKKKEIDSSIALMDEGYMKELYALHAAYAEKREATRHELDTNTSLSLAEKSKLNGVLLNLDAKYVDDFDKLNKENELKQLKFDKQLIDLKLEAVKAGSDQEYKLKKESLDKQLQIDLAQVTGSAAEKAALQKALSAKYSALQAKEDEKHSLNFIDDQLKQDITSLNAAQEQKLADLSDSRKKGTISQKEYNRQLLVLQSQYTQDSLLLSVEKAERELAILKAAGDDTSQAEQALASLRLKAQEAGTPKATGKGAGFKDWSTKDKLNASIDAAKMISDAEFQINRDNNQRILDHKLNAIASQRDAELSNKNLTEKQKAKIEAKYAAQEKIAKTAAWKKQHKADLAQAWVNLALMVGRAAVNTWPVPAIPLMAMAAIEGGLQIAAISSQKVPEFAKGRFNVTGQSGKEYTNMPYMGPARTGLYTHPAIVGETGSEIIIDPQTTRNIIMNYPGIMSAIQNARIPQFATGRYPEAGVTPSPGPGQTMDFTILAAMNEFSAAIRELKTNGVHLDYQKHKDMSKKESLAESITSM